MRERTYKQIEDSRDRRLWITQVVIPLATLGVILYTNDNARREIKNTITKAKMFGSAVVNSAKRKCNELKEEHINVNNKV